MRLQFPLFPPQTASERDDELRERHWLEAKEWVANHGGGPVTVLACIRLEEEKLMAMGFTIEQISVLPCSWRAILAGFESYATLEEQRQAMKIHFADCDIKWPW